jgi:hypothetical protein
MISPQDHINKNVQRRTFNELDDIYCALMDKIPNLYRMKVYRCLKRYNLDKLPEEPEKRRKEN